MSKEDFKNEDGSYNIEAIQKRVSELDEEMLGSWTSCMRGKIVRHYGPEVEDCVKSITHSNWKSILKCIVTIKGITNPEVWIAEQLGYFTAWSLACLF